MISYSWTWKHELFTWSCTTKLRLHDTYHGTWYISCQGFHEYHIMYTWYDIHEHLHMICIMYLKMNIMLTWSDCLHMNLFPCLHELLFHVNEKSDHVFRFIMYTWWVIMFHKGIFFWRCNTIYSLITVGGVVTRVIGSESVNSVVVRVIEKHCIFVLGLYLGWVV